MASNDDIVWDDEIAWDPQPETKKKANKSFIPGMMEGIGNRMFQNLSGIAGLFGSEVNPIAKLAKEHGIPVPADIVSQAMQQAGGGKNEAQWAEGQPGAYTGHFIGDLVSSLPLEAVAPYIGLGNKANLLQKASHLGYDALLNAIKGSAFGAATSNDNRKESAKGGFIGGAAGTFVGRGAMLGAGGAQKIANTLVDSFTETGAKRSVQSTVKKVLGENSDDIVKTVIRNDLIKSRPKGVNPMTAELGGNSGGLNAMQNKAEVLDPQNFQLREIANVNARKAAIDAMGATPENIAQSKVIMENIGNKIYKPLMTNKVPINQTLRKLSERPIVRSAFENYKLKMENMGTPLKQDVIDSFYGNATKQSNIIGPNGKPYPATIPNEDVSGESIHHMKLALDNLLEDAKNPLSGINQEQVRKNIKDFKSWRTSNFPEYNKAQNAYANASRPYNRAVALQEIKKQAYPAQSEYDNATTESLTGFANAIHPDSNIVNKIPGYAKKITQVLDKKDIRKLKTLAESMAASSHARSGSGGDIVGSSMQDLSGRLARSPAEIAAASTGIPGAYGLTNALSFGILEKLTGKHKKALSEAMRNPKTFKEIMQMQQHQNIIDKFNPSNPATRVPGILGYILGKEANN